jgi:hypothetical protein
MRRILGVIVNMECYDAVCSVVSYMSSSPDSINLPILGNIIIVRHITRV